MARARCGPIPGTSRTRSGAASSTSSVRSPNVPTIRFARTGPIWRTIPDPRYRTMPSTSLGRRTSAETGRNCAPWRGSVCQWPLSASTSPGWAAGSVPTTVIGSRRPRTRSRTTLKPLVGL